MRARLDSRIALERRLEIAPRAADIAQLPPQQSPFHQSRAVTRFQFQRRLDIVTGRSIAFERAARAGPQHQQIGATVSGGVARIDSRGADYALGVADRALYEAKAGGRNQLALAA